MATFSFALAGVGPSAMALQPEVREFRRVGGLSRTAGARG